LIDAVPITGARVHGSVEEKTMTGIARIFFAFLLFSGTALTAHVGYAEDLSPQAFFGNYKGSGSSHGPALSHFGFGDRDLDVVIGPEGDGFFVAWTTVIREAWEDAVRRNSARISFVPSDRPGIYIEQEAARRIGHGLSWAVIQGSTLTVRALAVRDDGTYAVQTYHRTLTEKGMFLHFISDQDGQSIRTVTANLAKDDE
jgi:hypothetical protein